MIILDTESECSREEAYFIVIRRLKDTALGFHLSAAKVLYQMHMSQEFYCLSLIPYLLIAFCLPSLACLSPLRQSCLHHPYLGQC